MVISNINYDDQATYIYKAIKYKYLYLINS